MKPEVADTVRRALPRPALAIGVSVVAIVFGILTSTLFLIIAGGLFLLINVGLLILLARTGRQVAPVPPQTDVRDAVLAELGPGWRADEAAESGHGFTNVPTVTFARGAVVGPALWFESATVVRVRFPVPGAREVSQEVWPPADLSRLVGIVVALSRGEYTTPSDLFVTVTVDGKDVRLEAFPSASLRRADHDET